MPNGRKSLKRQPKTPKQFPIVGIGASAGGLEAISQLLAQLPPNTGIALVVVQHLDPSHESLSAEILSRITRMPVEEIEDGITVQANHVYIIPPNHNLAILHGVLSLMPRTETRGTHMAVDYFFQSLAQDQKNKAIGIVLSGTGADGTQGLEAIKAEGGLAFVQDPISAKYDGMPHSAIASGAVDLVLTPQKIAEELSRLARHPLLTRPSKVNLPSAKIPSQIQGDSLTKIFALLRNQSHVDFSHYKPSTIKRRIARRMVIQKSKKLEDYFSLLQSNPQEIRALFADILINVTEFFRDPDIFAALKKQVLSKIMKHKPAGAPIRIWVVGCATGEEAYSVAISLLEVMGDEAQKATIQIFATDISESALQKARAGVYPESIRKNVSPERLSRFFEKTETGYKISKRIRDMCLFSRHDVTSDPPFSKVDLICCRNLLIYFDSALQKHVLPILHYALNPDGFLWLGRSESVGNLSTLFRVTDKAKKFYLRSPAPPQPRAQFGASTYTPETPQPAAAVSRNDMQVRDFQREADQALISQYAPPGVLVNNGMEIVLVRGETAPYLKLTPGQASLNLFKMARQELVSDLRMMIQAAKEQSSAVRKEDLSIHDGNQVHFLNISVIPLKAESGNRDRHFWILFEPAHVMLKAEAIELAGTRKRVKGATKRLLELKDRRIAELDRQISEGKVYQRTLVEEFESTQEEITSANEELQSTNEELQSTNEELETAKEELQSTNEELTTVNDELQNRNSDLNRLNNDLVNLLGAVDFPIVMVGVDGRIRRFTPTAGKLLNLLPADVGRPIGDIRPGFDQPDLQPLVSEVIETITVKEQEVHTREGHIFRLQVRPYKTTDNRIDGAVISLIDITLLKDRLFESQSALRYATSVADTLPLPLVVLDEKLRILSINQGFSRKFAVAPEKEVGLDLIGVLGAGAWKNPRLRRLLVGVIVEDRELKDFEIEHDFPGVGRRIMCINAQRIRWQDAMPKAMLLSIEDITERRTLERVAARAKADAEHANEAKDVFLATLSHELRTPLTAIYSWSQLLKKGPVSPEKLQRGLDTIDKSARAQAQLINDLLDISRIQTGKLALALAEVAPDEIVRAAVQSVRLLADEKGISIDILDGHEIGRVRGDPARLQQVIWNLLTNSIKFSPEGSKIEVHIEKIQDHGRDLVSIRVVDHGKGIDPAFLPNLFTRFSQQDSTSTRVHGGLGIGLALVRDLVNSHGGSVKAESPGRDQGATFSVSLPLASEALREAASLDGEKRIAKSVPPDLSGVRVLVVDDEPSSLESLVEIVRSFGGEPIQSSSAHDAMIAFERFRPDVVVSDIAMPLEDGYSLLQKLRALPPEQGGRVPAMALSAYAAQHDVARAIAAGFQEHMAKPFDSEEFGRAIARLVKKK